MTKEKSNDVSRRDFFKAGAVLSCALAVSKGTSAALPASRETLTANAPAVRTQRTLGEGKARLNVSGIGFGCMGLTYNRGAHPPKKDLIRLLHAAVDRGVTFFDTAEGYGPFTNEELVGEALAPYRDKVVVATKFGHAYKDGKRDMSREDSRPEHIRQVCDECLKRLKTDAIGLFYQHRFDVNTPIEDVAGTVGDLIRAGKVRAFGLCEVGAETIRKAHREYPVTAVQSEYSLMWRAQESLFPTLDELGIGFVPYSPLGRGFLGGCITEYTRFGPENDNRQTLPRFTPQAIRNNLRLVEKLNVFGRTRGMTAAQVALAWLAAKNGRIVAIPGTTKLSHLEENLRAAEFSLSPEEVAGLDAIAASVEMQGDRYNAQQAALVGK